MLRLVFSFVIDGFATDLFFVTYDAIVVHGVIVFRNHLESDTLWELDCVRWSLNCMYKLFEIGLVWAP